MLYPRYVLIHVIFLGAIIFFQWMFKGPCPLTLFERAMLAKCAPEEVYEDAFLRHYVKKYFGVMIPPGRIAGTTVALFIGSALLWGVESYVRK